MLINFSVSFVVCSVTPPPPQKVVEMVEQIRLPEG
jgi:hypothetical protein